MHRSGWLLIALVLLGSACVGDAPPATPDAAAPTVARLPADHPPIVSTWMARPARDQPVERGESCNNCHLDDGMLGK